MTDQLKNVVIGMFVVAACIIVVFLLLFLHPTAGDDQQTFKIRFADIDKVNVGTRVTFAGKPVGEVTEIREIEFDRDGPKDESDRVYVYELTITVDSAVKIFNTDDVTLRTSGLLGERSVAIFPIAPRPDVKPVLLTDKDIIYASQVGSVEETMSEFKQVADRLELTLDHVNGILQDIQDREVVTKIAATIDNIREISATLNKPDELNAMMDNFLDFSNELATRLPRSWDVVDKSLKEVHIASENIHAAAENAKNITINFGEVIDRVRRGEGTAGRILVNDDLYLRATSIFNKADTAMNDINQYGLLFHLDKGWQRMRARRANLLLKLSSPQQFRNFFNDEVDQISTSLERVAMVLDRSYNYPCMPLGLDPEFTKVFAELLRRVEGVETSLKMYDDQLMEVKVQETELNNCPCR